ncbi:MAG: hypothetical protein AB8B99_02140 [Phormidesmis sp.]
MTAPPDSLMPNSSTSDSNTPNAAAANRASSDSLTDDAFKISPLIQLTLTSLYIALVIPLPFLAEVTGASVSPTLLWIGFSIGGAILYGALSEKVLVDNERIAVTYPSWVQMFGRKGWSLRWSEITALKPRSTGQGGIVYYFLNQAQDRAFLLPMRVVGFARLLRYVDAKTELDLRDVKPLAQPWMYIILLSCTALLLLVDIWVIATANSFVPETFS